MFQLKLGLVAAGGFFAYWGFQDFKLGSAADKEPTTMTLTEIHNGKEIENANVILKGYVQSSAFFYLGDIGNGPSTSIQELYAPLLLETTQSEGDFKVLVKTDRFKTLHDATNGSLPTSEIKGVFINKISSLDSETKDLLKQNYPSKNVDDLLILEEGKELASGGLAAGKMGGGGLLSLLGLGWLVTGFRKK